MMNLGKHIQGLWEDEYGSTAPMAYVLVATIFCLGIIVGLTSLRNAVVQEFASLSLGLEALDQSYSYSVNSKTSSFADAPPTGLGVVNGFGLGLNPQQPVSEVGGVGARVSVAQAAAPEG